MAASGALAVPATPVPASAAGTSTLPTSLAKFAHCPVSVKAVAACLYSSMATTQFTIGSSTVSSAKPTTVSLGLITKPSGAIVAVLPTDGTHALTAPAIPLPGGLLGVPGVDTGPLAVDVQPQLAGTPSLNFGNLLSGKAPGFTMPIDVLVNNSAGVLGSSCTIGSPTSPIRLQLTTGTTKPPAPNKPITGSPGKASTGVDGMLIVSGMTLVDNSFAVPGAANCGASSLLAPVVDQVIDQQKGLPSAAGKNTAVLSGSSFIIAASVIRKYIG